MQTEVIDVKAQKAAKNDGTAQAEHNRDVPEHEPNKPTTTIIINKREKRNNSPNTALSDNISDPMSPSSSSTTSQATSGANDATFEPTIEMMVNDFDDEQTLNEEEALAATEAQDPQDEINTLKEEGEMPLDQLLAKYQALPPPPLLPPPTQTDPVRKKSKKSKKRKKTKHRVDSEKESLRHTHTQGDVGQQDILSDSNEHKTEIIVIESGDEKEARYGERNNDDNDYEVISSVQSVSKPSTPEETKDADECNSVEPGTVTVRHTHLLDLYPKGTFNNVVINNTVVNRIGKDIPLEMLYDVADDDDDELEEEEEDDDYKKKIMVGPLYQATIPTGLSQYGDILPYENEDKLIWEPSQVSEREVEEYLLKIREIKPNLGDDDEAIANDEYTANDDDAAPTLEEERNIAASCALDGDTNGVVKDNEQALHLLVQCGYDFKEALRRKRLNALPLNDTMSLWSEEECQKFEEGIQKYGKDFLKIRQYQVRTRTMRELVQFYYLWKKSERRDQNFANADTVDHMDIYLNEDNDYGSNPSSSITPAGSPIAPITYGTRRNSQTLQKNFSIMTGAVNSNSSIVVSAGINTNVDNSKQASSYSFVSTANKRRPSSSNVTVGSDHVLESNQSVNTHFSK